MSTNPPGAPGSRLKLRIQATPESTLVICSGKLTSEVSAEFKKEVRELIPQTKRLVLDLNDVVFMDSSGLGALVSLYVSAKAAGCELGLINLNKQLRELLRFTRVLSLFEACGQYPVRMP